MKNTLKTFAAMSLVLITTLTFTACGSSNKSSVFPSVDSSAVPDVLEKTVGRVGNTYFTSFGKSRDKDYTSFFAVNFEETTEDDYTELVEHYQAESTGTDDDGMLLFDWGRLHTTRDKDMITVNAFIK